MGKVSEGEMKDEQKQHCEFPGCPAQARLTELIPDPNALPRMVKAGDEFPKRTHLKAWVCEMNPKRHVQVIGWGFRLLKDCTVPGCDGVMIHTDKARITAPDDLRKLPSKPYARLIEQAGFLCMKDKSHVELEPVEVA
jgi:hypothetical protein